MIFTAKEKYSTFYKFAEPITSVVYRCIFLFQRISNKDGHDEESGVLMYHISCIIYLICRKYENVLH